MTTGGTFFNKMTIFKTFSRLYQRNHRIPNLFKAPAVLNICKRKHPQIRVEQAAIK
jgi:hypothetical protein